jgi:hypothetical protein
MPRAVTTSLDFSTANRLRARRRVAEADVRRKVAILQRVYRQFVSGTLPRSTESNVEQSWNEQVFAAVLDYRTQFSHDRLPYHLKPKSYQGGYFPDFVLGFFGEEEERVVAAAELKGPLADLDRPQGEKYDNLTAVEQAVRGARAKPGCRWALVSNFRELRLYDVTIDKPPLLVADLNAVTDAQDLALLQALLGRSALLGNGRQPSELATMIDLPNDHPSSPLSAQDGRYRLVIRFTPSEDVELPLFVVEQRLRSVVTRGPGWGRFFQNPGYGLPVDIQSRLEDGWVGIDGRSAQNDIGIRVAMSLLGQVQMTLTLKARPHQLDDKTHAAVEFVWLTNGLRYFAGILTELHDLNETAGLLAAELREVENAFMFVEGVFLSPFAQNSGVVALPDILAGDFHWRCAGDRLELAAICACELAAYFRGPQGGIGVDHEKVRAHMAELNKKEAPDAP